MFARFLLWTISVHYWENSEFITRMITNPFRGPYTMTTLLTNTKLDDKITSHNTMQWQALEVERSLCPVQEILMGEHSTYWNYIEACLLCRPLTLYMLLLKCGPQILIILLLQCYYVPWNSLPSDVRRADTVKMFKKRLKTFLFYKHHGNI